MFVFEYNFFFSLFLVCSARYYAFVETLFIIDQIYFPPMSSISYEDYVQTIVNTANIVFQSANDLDVKIEIIVSNILYLNIARAKSQQPYAYEKILRQQVPNYNQYDSIVLFWYQPWEGPEGALGYAMVGGICHPSYKILYLVPHQSAALYLAHEIGHQLGLKHQVDGSCFTESRMSVMTIAHTASYDRARWTTCENQWINENICKFECLFNKPDHYQPIKNKFANLPGQTMKNDQQAKMIEMNAKNLGEAVKNSYKENTMTSRCLYLQYYIDEQMNDFRYAYSPMLPGSDCQTNSICYMDKCLPKDQIDSSALQIVYDNDILDLQGLCSSTDISSELAASNDDPHQPQLCVDWEDDFLCRSSVKCPVEGDRSFLALYINHICCNKCVKDVDSIATLFTHAQSIEITWISILLPLLILISLSEEN